jgi:tRNA U54 and U55 pseudouridine synthase Pus10
VEHCSVCGGIWLYANEWKALQSANLHDKIYNIISSTWQTQVRGEEMIASLEKTYVKRFGTETYEKVKEIRQWLQEQPQRDAILAFLSDPDPFEV